MRRQAREFAFAADLPFHHHVSVQFLAVTLFDLVKRRVGASAVDFVFHKKLLSGRYAYYIRKGDF